MINLHSFRKLEKKINLHSFRKLEKKVKMYFFYKFEEILNLSIFDKLDEKVKIYFLHKFEDKEFINPITVDLHSHLLPGIDDGVRTMEESIKIIKKLHSLGYRRLITTPHIMLDSYPNTKSIIQKKLFEVQKSLREEQIDIKIEAGAEHYIDMDFLKLLEKDEVVPFSGNYLLFETSYISKPIILEQAIFDMQSKGYIPVLAHPERYRYMHDNIDAYKELKTLGVLFQVNAKSLRSISGSVHKMALKLIKLGLIDFIGSDIHRMRDATDLENIIKAREYQMIFKKNKIFNNELPL